jgi:ABC-type microcin C transport system permease subunit YejE
MSSKELTRDIIAVIIILGAVASLFFTVTNITGERLLQTLAGLVVGYYFGVKQLPLGAVVGGKIRRKK